MARDVLAQKVQPLSWDASRRDAEVAIKCLLRSLVIRKKSDILERGLEVKESRRRKRESRERRKVGRVGREIMVGCITISSSRSNALSTVE